MKRWAVAFGLFRGLALWPAAAGAQTQPAASSDQAAVEQPTAPVTVDGIGLFQVRGISVYPAETRAEAVAARIEALAADRKVPVDSIVVRETPQASVLAAGEQQLISVLDEDAQMDGIARPVLAEFYRRRIVDAVERYRHDREAPVLWRNAAEAAFASLVFVLV